MAAYVIARVRVTNADQYGKYKLLTPAAVAAHGGTFIVRGGEHQVLEGAADDRRIVVLEFPTSDDARTFYDSPEYVEARAVRDGAAEMEMVLVEGA
jgi:uncharacterized protein (DUF1330 family)